MLTERYKDRAAVRGQGSRGTRAQGTQVAYLSHLLRYRRW